MTTKTFDPTKPVQTRDGRAARIICTDRKDTAVNNPCPLIALVTQVNGLESYYNFQLNGRFSIYTTKSDADLINIPEERWVNFYQAKNGDIIMFGGHHQKIYKGYAIEARAHEARHKTGLYVNGIYYKYISTVNILG